MTSATGNVSIPVGIVPFERRYSQAAFDCGEPTLNLWLKEQASQQEKRDNTRTFLAVEEDRVVGYYASRSYQLDLDALASAFGTGKRKYPVPAILLARLAACKSVRGTGVGGRLLVHALDSAAQISRATGVELLVVDALNTDAAAFYGRYGFETFMDNPSKLFISTATLRKAVG